MALSGRICIDWRRLMAGSDADQPPPCSPIGRYTIALGLVPEPKFSAGIPAGFAGELGPEAFAVEVGGDSLAGHNPPIRAGDLCWIDHTRHPEPREGKPHVALVLESLDAEPTLLLAVWRGGRLYRVRPNRPGPPVESEAPVVWIYTLAPIIAVQSEWASPAVRP